MEEGTIKYDFFNYPQSSINYDNTSFYFIISIPNEIQLTTEEKQANLSYYSLDDKKRKGGGYMNGIMEIRKQVRLSQWNEMVREREESGLSIREFCAGKSISPKTYYYRLRKLREAAIETSTPEIVQVDIPEPFNPGGIIIRTNAATIEITGNANPETVRAAVSFLR